MFGSFAAMFVLVAVVVVLVVVVLGVSGRGGGTSCIYCGRVRLWAGVCMWRRRLQVAVGGNGVCLSGRFGVSALTVHHSVFKCAI